MIARPVQRRFRFAGRALLVVLAAAAMARPAAAARDPGWCLPPVFEGGRRLHALPSPSVYWLPLALRQHELCHEAAVHPDAPRALLIGNSAVFGFPLPVDATLGEQLNRHLAARGAPGHVFNLGWVNNCELRDALVLRAALDYRPDVIIYGVTLADFVHSAPALLPSVTAFFQSNAGTVRALADAPLPGLADPLQRYASWAASRGRPNELWAQLRDSGAFVRAATQASAETLARWADPTLPPAPIAPTRGRQMVYDCSQTMAKEREDYADWQSWNVLAYLQTIRNTYGIPIIVLNWPVAYEPIGDCYSVRYSTAAVDEFSRWLRAESDVRGFAYVDLHDLLPGDQFFDSLHPTAEGHRRIAERLGPLVEGVLRQRAAQRPPELSQQP